MSQKTRVEREIVREIVQEENRVSNPYATLDKLMEKLGALKPHLATLAQTDGAFTTYWELKDDVGIFTSRQGVVLGVLGWHEDEIGNPPLPALVQNKNEPMPNDGYFVMVEKARHLTDHIPETERKREEIYQNHVRMVRDKWQ